MSRFRRLNASPRRHFSACILIFAISMTALSAQAQGTVAIKGIVMDGEAEQPLGYATVSLYLAADSTLQAGVITNDDGSFLLEGTPGEHYIVINFMGYASKTLPDITLNAGNKSYDVGKVTLSAATTELEAVVVSGEKNLVELTLDKKIFNVSQDPINAGRTAADILGNLPSISVDGQGNLLLRGSANVQVLIDGKPSGLLSFNGTEGLRQLQGNLIDHIEIITNPSARYQAEGMAGIINIILKKGQKQGLNGAVDLTAGHPVNLGVAMNVNYRRDNLNFFVNYGVFYRDISNPFNSLYQEYERNDSLFLTQQRNNYTQTALANNVQFGADYFFNETNILTTSFTYRHSEGTRNTIIEYDDYLFDLNNPQLITRRLQDETETEPNLEYSLQYKRNFGKEDHELNAVLTYINNWEDSDQRYTTLTFLPDNTPETSGDRIEDSDNYETEKQLLLQADYVYPFGEKGKLEAGIRNTLRDITNDYLVARLIDGVWVPLEGFDNEFFYDENIYAAYLIASNKKGKVSYQIGLRGEYTDLTTELVTTQEVNPRQYFNLFPSAHMTYDIDQKDALQLSYSRRLHRPTYNDLTPFFTFVDERNFTSGNPDLNPEYTHAFEAGHIRYFEGGSVSSAIYYRHTSDKIERVRQVDENGFATIRPYNLDVENAYGAEIISDIQPLTWLKLDLSLNFYRSIIDGNNLDVRLQSDTYTWFTRINTRFTVWGNTDFQFRTSYEAPQQTPQGRRLSTTFVDFSVIRDLLKNKATLSLNVIDIFRSNRNRSITEGDAFYTRSDFLRSPRQVNLTFNYRLNQPKSKS